MQRVLDHCLYRRKAGSAGDEYRRLVGFLAQVESAQRTFEAKDLAPLVLGEQQVGEKPVRHMPDVQFEQLVVVRCRGQRKTPALAVL